MQKFFKAWFAVVFLISSSFAIAGVHEAQPYSFNIHKHKGTLADFYRITPSNKETYAGVIKNSKVRIRTNYDLSNKDGWQATGITRILSLGAIYPWATDIDIYDTRGVQIGFIDGDMATLENAKFNIYEYYDEDTKDEDGNKIESKRIGIAYAYDNFTRFIILEPNSPHAIAEMSREHKRWHVTVNNPEQIDDRILRIFTGFVVNYENNFLSDEDLD